MAGFFLAHWRVIFFSVGVLIIMKGLWDNLLKPMIKRIVWGDHE